MIPGFHRVTRREPCPVCGRKDWCLISNDGSRVICPRIESKQSFGEAGFLHILNEPVSTRRFIQREKEQPTSIDFSEMWRKWMLETTTLKLSGLADELGVSRESLRSVGCVWAEDRSAWAFPMRDGDERIVGIRLRSKAGDKYAVKGSNGSGLFIPSKATGASRVFICEGPTDCAALLDRECFAIGRPSCNAGGRFVNDLLRKLKPREVIIFADADGPGLRGAEQLADTLFASTKIISPPRHKDARAWICAGASRLAIEAVIGAARYHKRKEQIPSASNHRMDAVGQSG